MQGGGGNWLKLALWMQSSMKGEAGTGREMARAIILRNDEGCLHTVQS